jgi:hypothetical protein
MVMLFLATEIVHRTKSDANRRQKLGCRQAAEMVLLVA